MKFEFRIFSRDLDVIVLVFLSKVEAVKMLTQKQLSLGQADAF